MGFFFAAQYTDSLRSKKSTSHDALRIVLVDFFCKDIKIDVWLWILCGLPFGLHRMCLWIVPGGGSLGGGIALFALNFIIGGVIGGFVLAWRLIVAVWYVPLTVYRLIVG